MKKIFLTMCMTLLGLSIQAQDFKHEVVFSISCNDNAKAADPKAKDESVTAFMFQATALGAEFGGAVPRIRRGWRG